MNNEDSQIKFSDKVKKLVNNESIFKLNEDERDHLYLKTKKAFEDYFGLIFSFQKINKEAQEKTENKESHVNLLKEELQQTELNTPNDFFFDENTSITLIPLNNIRWDDNLWKDQPALQETIDLKATTFQKLEIKLKEPELNSEEEIIKLTIRKKK